MKQELTSQELLDRYIHATMLPPDIAAEVRSHLESLAEDRAVELGRELRPDEMSEILKQRGHPARVAISYRDPNARGLISPALFPLYWFTLRAVFALWVTIRVIVAVFTLQGTATAGSVLPLLGRDILLAVFFIGGGVTLLFALWEFLEFKFRYSERWKPESLPPVWQPPQPLKQPRPVVQIIGGLVGLSFFAAALFSPALFWMWGGRGMFSPAEALYAMRLPLWLLVVFGVAQSWLGYTRFAKTEWRRSLVTALCAAGLALAIWLLRAGDLLVAGPNWVPAQAKPLATLNQMLAGVMVLASILAGLVCVNELRRFIRKTGRRVGGDRQTADSAS